jgi:mannitol 2-dehydrogenase
MTALDSSILQNPPTGLAVPGYDRRQVEIGIVHFGVGAFHRAHEAMYVDRILAAGDRRWGICGVGVRPADRAVRDALARQDGLYTLVTVAPDGTARARVIGSIVTVLHAPDDPVAVIARLAAPTTRIVSLTITEGGYEISDDTGEFAPRNPATLADLADPGAPPRSVFGFLAAALRLRRDSNTAPFTVLSCDNIPGNGTVARKATVAFAERHDPALASWIADGVAFPDSMVDRITPATTPAVGELVSRDYGVHDAWPIRSETYTQWVLEDRFPAGRPELDTVGVQLVPDVEPYELMKLRLLNASHQVMAYLGLLRGMTYVHEACQDPDLRAFLLGYMDEEARPSLLPVPGVDLTAYCRELLARFSSEAILDTLARQGVDGSDRIPKFLLPVVRHRLAAGAPIGHCALVVAAWSKVVDGLAESGEPMADHREAELRAAAAAERAAPGAFISVLPDVFGDLSTDPTFAAAFTRARTLIEREGVRTAMSRGAGHR